MTALAILCSDVHFSHLAPLARSSEPDWYEAMRRPLNQMRELVIENECPLIIAGDIFDKWNSPPELINFAIDELKRFRPFGVYCIPGQHDLPGHNYQEMRRSAYGSLIRAGAVIDVPGGEVKILNNGVCIHSFPWGFPVKPLSEDDKIALELPGDIRVHLAVVHAYIWKAGCSYPGADDAKLVANVKESLEGYTAAVFGDNHIGFQSGKVLNNGGLMRRKIDEIDYRPGCGILLENGTIVRHYFDTSEDSFIDREKYLEVKKEDLNFDDYIEELREMGLSTLDFREELKRRMEIAKTDRAVRSTVLELLE